MGIIPGHYQDDWGVTCIQMYCAANDTWWQSRCNGGGNWHEDICPEGQKICGFRTRQVWGKGDSGDGMGMTALITHCCYRREAPPPHKAVKVFDGDDSWNSAVLGEDKREQRRLEEEKIRLGG